MTDRINIFMGAAFLVLIALVILDAISDVQKKNEFMNECLKERKKYECTALWRSGESNFVPVPVPIVVSH